MEGKGYLQITLGIHSLVCKERKVGQCAFGREWRFFYLLGSDDYSDCQVFALDLNDNDSKTNASLLQRYLNYKSVQDGDAIMLLKMTIDCYWVANIFRKGRQCNENKTCVRNISS